jgi:hypothetical protein
VREKGRKLGTSGILPDKEVDQNEICRTIIFEGTLTTLAKQKNGRISQYPEDVKREGNIPDLCRLRLRDPVIQRSPSVLLPLCVINPPLINMFQADSRNGDKRRVKKMPNQCKTMYENSIFVSRLSYKLQ